MRKKTTSPAAPKTGPTGMHVWLVMMKTMQAVSRIYARMLKQSALGDSDFRILEVLLSKGPLPVNTIGPLVELTPGSISIAIDRLYKKRLVSRDEDPEDRRVRIVALTPEGWSLVEPVLKCHAEELERIMSVLSAEQRVQLEGMLKQVGRNAEKV